MKREWRHEVSETWLRTRKLYLTASDIKRLVAEARRIESGKIELIESKIFAKLYGEKQSNEIDVESYGAMARGHIIEPYAIDDYNKATSVDGRKTFHWWDDAIICRDRIGFSPDGLDVTKLPGTRILRQTVLRGSSRSNATTGVTTSKGSLPRRRTSMSDGR